MAKFTISIEDQPNGTFSSVWEALDYDPAAPSEAAKFSTVINQFMQHYLIHHGVTAEIAGYRERVIQEWIQANSVPMPGEVAEAQAHIQEVASNG